MSRLEISQRDSEDFAVEHFNLILIPLCIHCFCFSMFYFSFWKLFLFSLSFVPLLPYPAPTLAFYFWETLSNRTQSSSILENYFFIISFMPFLLFSFLKILLPGYGFTHINPLLFLFFSILHIFVSLSYFLGEFLTFIIKDNYWLFHFCSHILNLHGLLFSEKYFL